MKRIDSPKCKNNLYEIETNEMSSKIKHGTRHNLCRFAIVIAMAAFLLGGCNANDVPEAGMDAWDKEESSKAAETETEEEIMESDSESETVIESESETEPEKQAETESATETEEKKSEKETEKETEKEKKGILSFLNKNKKVSKWVKYDSREEAQDAAGLIISDRVLTEIKDYTYIEYRAIDDTMIEIIFRNKSGQEGYRFRQGYGTDDISGDSKDYDEEKEYKIGKTIVHTRGANGRVAIATYTDGELTYAFVGAAYQPTLLELMGMYYLFG